MKAFVKTSITHLLIIFLLAGSNGFAQQLSSVSPQPVAATQLQGLIEQALENNPEIKAMQRRYDMMRARIPQLATSPFLGRCACFAYRRRRNRILLLLAQQF